jgi:1,2-diacylglycerol 3-alpha-glucosyltransferase
MASAPLRVLFCCTGVGILNRGIESFFREAFDHLHAAPGLEARLVKGGGPPSEFERAVPCIPRTSRLAAAIGTAVRRNAYVAEQWSSFLPVVRQIRQFRPGVVFYSDANLGFLLYWFRRWIGVPYRLLFSNGGPCQPPFVRLDFVHQVNPVCLEQALCAGEPAAKHIMVPYGLRVGPPPDGVAPAPRRALRERLGLPADRPVVLSVGWISRAHKRMHYVVEEVARLPAPRPFLMLLGAMDRSSDEIVRLAHERLGPDGFTARSVPYDEVAQYYAAADCFVLASLSEGFGRVFLEALAHGLPVIAHRHPVMAYVLGEHGILTDLSVDDVLARHLRQVLARPADGRAMRQRWESVRRRFDWEILAPEYRRMFRRAACDPLPHGQARIHWFGSAHPDRIVMTHRTRIGAADLVPSENSASGAPGASICPL